MIASAKLRIGRYHKVWNGCIAELAFYGGMSDEEVYTTWEAQQKGTERVLRRAAAYLGEPESGHQNGSEWESVQSKKEGEAAGGRSGMDFKPAALL